VGRTHRPRPARRRRRGRREARVITLVLGGARSGKSAIAEGVAARLPGPVTYVATGIVTDDDMAARIAAHRAKRPSSWTTVELDGDGDLAACLRGKSGTVVVDSLGTWVAGRTPADLEADGEKLVGALCDRAGDTVVVSDEVGMSVHPMTESGRHFVDALGALNQAVAAVADEVLLAVAGRAVTLDALA
jgi:adenosyl cobinamide kinase/adenosyl cobinamide phosphate guanylyltransferase